MNSNYGAQSIPAPAMPESMLAGSLSSLEAYLNDLGIAAEHLSGRLSPVLRPDNVEPLGKDQAADRSQPSPTVDRIQKLTDRVRRITTGLQETANRLEV